MEFLVLLLAANAAMLVGRFVMVLVRRAEQGF